MVQMIEVVCPYCQALLEMPSAAHGGPVEGESIICGRCDETFVLSGTAPEAPVPGPTGEYALGSVSDVKTSVGGLLAVWWTKVVTTMWGSCACAGDSDVVSHRLLRGLDDGRRVLRSIRLAKAVTGADGSATWC